MIKSSTIKWTAREKLKAKAKTCIAKVKSLRPGPTWTMKGGKRIRVRDMTNSHLVNTIRLLERMSVTETSYAAAFAEIDLGPDAYEWVNDCSDPSDYFPIYSDMIAEAERRGLDLSKPAYINERIASLNEFETVK